jgi:hypothetical protein
MCGQPVSTTAALPKVPGNTVFLYLADSFVGHIENKNIQSTIAHSI